MDKDNLEEIIMQLIMQSGQARSCLMQAVGMARNKQFDEADQLVKQAETFLQEAHNIQTSLIGMDEGEGKLPVSIILVHAQDHIMNAVLLMDVAKELILIHKAR